MIAPTMKAIILAAGRGNRLRPLTDSLPKPLVTINGMSLIEYHLYALATTEIRRVVINHAWLGDKIETKLGNGRRYGVIIDYSPEPEGGLETAGGIVQALPKLTDGNMPFLVVNGDIFTDFNFQEICQMSLPEGILAHLVLIPTPSYKASGDFGLENGKVLPQGQYTFAGISVLHPKLFAEVVPGKVPLAPLLREAMQREQVTGEIYQGNWEDIGTLERLEQARAYYSN